MKEFLLAPIPKRTLLTILGGVVVLFIGMLVVLQELNEYIDTQTIEQARFESIRSIYKNTTIEATNAIVYDVGTNTVLFSKFPTVRKPLASITKVMTALVGRTILPLTTPITISSKDITVEPDYALRQGDTWTAKDLTQYFLMKSSNDGSEAICNAVTELVSITTPSLDCIALMNQYAKNQGLTSLYFANASGLDLPTGAPSNFGSAYDVARLLHIAYDSHPELLHATSLPTATFTTKNYSYEAVNTDKILEDVGTILAGKTGFTYTAGGNLAILYEPRPGTEIAIVVLGSSRDGRFDDMLELVRRTNQYVRTLPL